MSSNPSPSQGSGPAGSGVSVQQLEQTTQAISQKLEALRAEQRGLRRVLVGGSLLLICTMLFFGWKLYTTGKENFSKAKIDTALASSRDHLKPELESRATRLYQQLAPVYTQAALERWEHIRPQLQSKIASEVQAFPVALQDRISADIKSSFERVQLNVNKSLAKELPSLTFEKLENVNELIKSSILTEADKLRDKLSKSFAAEQAHYKKILEKFPVPDATSKDRTALQKQFLHELIQLLDYEILVYGTPEGLTLDNIRMELNVGDPHAPVAGPGPKK